MQGNIQIFFRPKELPIWTSLSPEQLGFYLNLAISLGTPICRLIYITLPLLSLMLGFSLIAAPPIEYLAYGIPFILLLYIVPSWLCDYHQFQFWNEVYETIFCLPGLERLLQVLRDPFRIYGGIVTSKDASAKQQSFNLNLSWPLLLLLSLLLLTLAIRYLLPRFNPVAGSGAFGYQGETLMLLWALCNGLLLAVALLACIDQPVRRSTDRFPIQRVGHLQLQDRKLWGTTQDISEQGAEFLLQCPQADLQPGPVALELTDPDIRVEAELVRIRGARLALQFKQQPLAVESELLGLLYSGEHWFHRPRRLSTSDALLHWFGTLWRADPILRRFS